MFLAMFGLAAINMAAALLPVLTVELYPSPLRSLSFSCGTLAGQLAVVVAQFFSTQVSRPQNGTQTTERASW